MLTSLKRRLKLPIQSPSPLMTVSRNMDDLWDPPNYQVTEDTNCINDGCQCTSCLTNDVAEETALNELSCIEVLRTLNSKADTDIIELEEELMDLLIQFVCTDKEFSDMFSMCLRREIGFLNQSIRKLKDDTEDDLSTSRKPAESMLDILDSLFCLYIQKKDNKCADNINNTASSSCQVPSDIPFRETNKQTTTSSNDNQLEKNKTIINTSLEKHRFSQIRVKAEDPDANYPYTGLDRVSMENLKHQLIKIKCQTDEESTGSKSTHSIDSPTPNTQINSHEFQQPNVTLSLSSNNTYKRTQTLDSPLLLEEGADVALDMDCYKVGDLRAIAKQRGFKGYSKLRKLELAQALGIKIVEGKRKQKRKETLALTLT